LFSKEDIISELTERGISTEVKPESSKLGLGNAKEQLIDRLEEARLDVMTLSAEELEADLKAMALSTTGSKVKFYSFSSCAPQQNSSHSCHLPPCHRGLLKQRLSSERQAAPSRTLTLVTLSSEMSRPRSKRV
jgi:hypothetical protein